MTWQEHNRTHKTCYWDVVLPRTKRTIFTRDLWDNSLFDDPTIHHWLAARYAHNCGFRKIPGTDHVNKDGVHEVTVHLFVRLYDRRAALHFAAVWL